MIIVIKHRYEIAEYYYLVTLTKWSQFCKQNNFLERFSNITITSKIKIKSSFPAANYMFKVTNRNTRKRH